MAQKSQTALQKMQEIANRLISNTPELAKMLDNDSALKPKRPSSPVGKKSKLNQSNGLANSKNEMTANDYHDKCKDLNQQLFSTRDKCVNLEEQIVIIKQRFVEREIQYRKIIEELQDQIKAKSSLDSSDKQRMTQINDLHKEIIDNIGTIQNKTSKILVEQESDIRRFFNKKINEIKEKFKEDKINKTEKDQEYQQKEKQMVSELEWIKNIAHKIDEENKNLMKKYVSLKAQFQIQEKDKDILLKELLMKKKENAVLRSQVEQYEKLLNEVSKQMEDDGRNELEASRSKSNMAQDLSSSSRISQLKNDPLSLKRYQKTILHLNNVLAKEKKKIRQLKNLYMREIASKSDLQKIIRKLVDDTRESIVEIQKNKRKKKSQEQFSLEAREELLQKILANEKILTLIYDKTFYSNQQKNNMHFRDIPEDLQQILEDEEQEGFHS